MITGTSDIECADIGISDDTILECDHDFTVSVGTVSCDIINVTTATPTVIIEDDESTYMHLRYSIICRC